MEKHKPTTDQRTSAASDLVQARNQGLQGMRAPHRLEHVATVEEVFYINDSAATFLDAALASLSTMERRTVWIMGCWSDDMSEGHVQDLMRERVSAVVLFGHEGDAPSLQGATIYLADNVRMAVFLARELARAGEAVLFSPACPSGNGFANYEERGAEFKRTVKEL